MTLKIKNAKVCGNGKFKHTPKKKFCNTCTLFSILSGDFSFISMIFFRLYGKGYFQYMNSQFSKYEIQRWVEDVSQEVFISLYVKFLNGTMFKIKHIKAYIRQIIFNKSYDENSRIAKSISLDLLEYEKDSQA